MSWRLTSKLAKASRLCLLKWKVSSHSSKDKERIRCIKWRGTLVMQWLEPEGGWNQRGKISKGPTLVCRTFKRVSFFINIRNQRLFATSKNIPSRSRNRAFILQIWIRDPRIHQLVGLGHPLGPRSYDSRRGTFWKSSRGNLVPQRRTHYTQNILSHFLRLI